MTKWLLALLGLGLVLRFVLSTHIYSGDVNNHMAWGRDILVTGPQGMYYREFMSRYGVTPPTYPPVILYLFTASDWLFTVSQDVTIWLNSTIPAFPSSLVWWFEDQDTRPAFFKLWSIVSDIGIAIIAFRFLRYFKFRGQTALEIVSFLIIFNPVIIYNSSYWGQVDSVPVFFILLSVYEIVVHSRPLPSAIYVLLGLTTKQSTIIFLPLLSIFWFKHFPLKDFVKPIAVVLAVFCLMYLPFLSQPFGTYLHTLKNGSGSDYIVDHAFNAWYLFPSLYKVSDSTTSLVGINYRFLGYTLFAIGYSVLCLKLYRKPSPQNLFGALGLSVLFAFFMLTRMHERYLLPAIPLLVLGFANKKLLTVTCVMSLFSFLNHYHNWWAPRIPWLVEFVSHPTTILVIVVSSYIFSATYIYNYLRR